MSHISVLLHETVDALVADRNTGIFIDGTFGRGGHTRLLLSKLDENARVYGFDKDPQALETAAILEQEDPRFKIIHASFADIQVELSNIGITEVDGIMADLGVSSPQLDQAERGFSFMHDGPLDMRMDNSQGLTAAEWLLEIEEEKLNDFYSSCFNWYGLDSKLYPEYAKLGLSLEIIKTYCDGSVSYTHLTLPTNREV